ncbi:MAG TPA: FAD-dependent oxidoreductase [Acidimicrobiia bacterium]|jgi:D-amino-acid dehydrogenase
MDHTPDIIVVGGGLVGVACAYELARDGHRVTVVDRHDAGRATDAGAGILSPETMGGMPAPFLDLADLAGDHYRALIPALVDAGAPDPRYAVCGALRIAFREYDDEAFAVNRKESMARHPDALSTVSPAEANKMFPPLGEIRDAFFNERGARVDGREIAAALEFAARALGVDWRTGSVERIVVEDDRAVAVESADRTIACGAVVIAGGAWTPALAGAFGLRCGVRPVRGQIVHLDVDADTSSWPVLQPIFSHYVVPWHDSRVALGATVEDVGFDARPTAAGFRQLFSEGLRVSPGLADATFREVRVGLRPVSDDDLPILGPLPDAPNVHVATGHGANGLLFGPVTGRLVADLIAGRTPALDLAPFSPGRLAAR